MDVGTREATRHVDAEIRARLRVGKPAEIHADIRGRSRVVTDLRRSRASTGVRIGARRIAGQEVSTAQKALRTAETQAQPVGTVVLRIVQTTQRSVATVARTVRTTLYPTGTAAHTMRIALRAVATRARMVGTRVRPARTARIVGAATKAPLARRAARQATSPSRPTVSKSDTLTV